jgi:hypothetical protein
MARRPLLPFRMTIALSFMASLLIWLGASGGADAVLPGPAATAVGIVAGVVALVALPTLLGWPGAGILLLMAVGGLGILGGFISQLDDIGLARALAIFVPAAIVLVAVVWGAKRLVLPGQRLSDHV